VFMSAGLPAHGEEDWGDVDGWGNSDWGDDEANDGWGARDDDTWDNGDWGDDEANDGWGAFERAEFTLYGYIENEVVVAAPAARGDTDPAFGNTLSVRLKGDWHPHRDLSFYAELLYQDLRGIADPAVSLAAASPLFAGGAGGAGGAGNDNGAAGAAGPKTESVVLDHAYGEARFAYLDLRFGRQPIAWGTGYLFNPTDRLSGASLSSPGSDETPGTLAVAPTVQLHDRLSLAGYLAFEDRGRERVSRLESRKANNYPFGVRLSSYAGVFDFSASFSKEVSHIDAGAAAMLGKSAGYQERYFGGADFAGSIGDVGVYGEAAVVLAENDLIGGSAAPDSWSLEKALFTVVGFDYTLPGEIGVQFEYYRQGDGATRKADYSLAELLSGRRSVQARDYLVAVADRSFASDRVELLSAVILNLNDYSIVAVPEIEWQLRNDFSLGLNAALFFGERGSEFDGRYDLSELGGEGSVDLLRSRVGVSGRLSF
ncbi:MAG: hypothetical protein EA428_13880, partial [Spirochaetaceae bacterium]